MKLPNILKSTLRQIKLDCFHRKLSTHYFYNTNISGGKNFRRWSDHVRLSRDRECNWRQFVRTSCSAANTVSGDADMTLKTDEHFSNTVVYCN
ncbi:hypothetical protein ElyMa_000063700 [Elysia marginata]|uniref:Uncharacterized protein n=1 Tax=Elysia marginata TaxID=1093978 RepID=A0AAV4EGB6_9GAST|nr:hypothetical protein ElyMa_000063700 [Elysia marginata]